MMTDADWGRLVRFLNGRGLVLVVPLHGKPYTRFRQPWERKAKIHDAVKPLGQGGTIYANSQQRAGVGA